MTSKADLKNVIFVTMSTLLITSVFTSPTLFQVVHAKEQSSQGSLDNSDKCVESGQKKLEQKAKFSKYKHSVWTQQEADEESEIYYQRSIGDVCESAIILSGNIGTSTTPKIRVSGLNVCIAWEDNTKISEKGEEITGDYDIFTVKSTDGGDTFGIVDNVSNTLQDSLNAKIRSCTLNSFSIGWSDSGETGKKAYSSFISLKERKGESAAYKINTRSFDPTLKVDSWKNKYTLDSFGRLDVGLLPGVELPDTGKIVPGIRMERPDDKTTIVDSGAICVKFVDKQVTFLESGCNSTNIPRQEWILKSGGVAVKMDRGSPDVKCDGNTLAPMKSKVCYDDATVTMAFSGSSAKGVETYAFEPGLPMKSSVAVSTMSSGSFTLVDRLTEFNAKTIELADDKIPIKEEGPVEGALNVTQFKDNGKLVLAKFEGIALGKLIGATITEVGSGNEVSIEYEYGKFSGSFTLDPSYCTSGCPFEIGGQIATDPADTSSTCPSNYTTASPTGTTPSLTSFGSNLQSTNSAGRCIKAFLEWDTTAMGDSVTNVRTITISFYLTASGISATSTKTGCNILGLHQKPSGTDFASDPDVDALGTDMNDGRVYVSNGSFCRNASSPTLRSATLSTSLSGICPAAGPDMDDVIASTNLKCLLPSDWFGVGIIINPWSRDSVSHWFAISTSNAISISIEYNV